MEWLDMSIPEHRHCWSCKKVLTLPEFNHRWQETPSTSFPDKMGSRATDHHENDVAYFSMTGLGDPLRKDDQRGFAKYWGICDNCGKTFVLNKEPICTFHLNVGSLGRISSSLSPSKEIQDLFGETWGEGNVFRCILKQGHKGVHAAEINGNSINWEPEPS